MTFSKLANCVLLVAKLHWHVIGLKIPLKFPRLFEHCTDITAYDDKLVIKTVTIGFSVTQPDQRVCTLANVGLTYNQYIFSL